MMTNQAGSDSLKIRLVHTQAFSVFVVFNLFTSSKFFVTTVLSFILLKTFDRVEFDGIC